MVKRIQAGDILAIPLPNETFAFCRVLKDASIGVYDYVAPRQDQPPPLGTRYAFVVGVYRDVLTCGEWPRVYRHPFLNDNDAWPPPYAVRDVLSGVVSIYHKGVVRLASPGEAEGLEPAAVWDKEQIVTRIATTRQ